MIRDEAKFSAALLARGRIAQAESIELEQWLERVIPAESPKDIFADG